MWQSITWASGLLLARTCYKNPGKPRLAVAAPIVVMNFLLPLLFDGKADIMTTVIAFMNTSGISNYKLLAWVLDRGPLAESYLTPSQFCAVYVLALVPATAAAGIVCLFVLMMFVLKRIDFSRCVFADSRRDAIVPPETFQKLVLLKAAALCGVVPIYAMYIDALPRFPAVFLQGLSFPVGPVISFLQRLVFDRKGCIRGSPQTAESYCG